MTEKTDIFISGGGIAGLAAACAFGSAGFHVICADPVMPVTTSAAPNADLRSTAFLQPSLPVLKQAGLWDRLAPYAGPLHIMRIIDAGGKEHRPRIIKDFNAADLSNQPFGWNLPNWLLRREMSARLNELPNVTFLGGRSAQKLFTCDNHAHIHLDDGHIIQARLAIGADGRASTIRDELGIRVKTWRYGQKALAFVVTHPTPHHNISTEIHRSGGPFTFVPLPDHEGKPCSAIVWMDHSAEVMRRLHLPAAEFQAEMMARSCHILGALTPISPLTHWPIIAQMAQRLIGQRTALMAEAAHVVPPIGAQGLNMSLADLTVLLELASNHQNDLGSAKMLQQYEQRRRHDIHRRIVGIDLLNRASMIGARPLRDIRAGLLNTLYSIAPVRHYLMQAGIGVR